MKSTRFWIGIIAILLAVSSVAAVLQFTNQERGGFAEIYQNGVFIKTISLNVDAEFTVKAENGGYNTIRVADGKIAVVEASCPDKICIHQGAASSGVKPIVCLPNRLVIRVVSTAKEKIDAIVR